MNALLTKSTTDAPQSASKTPFLTPSTSPSHEVAVNRSAAASPVGHDDPFSYAIRSRLMVRLTFHGYQLLTLYVQHRSRTLTVLTFSLPTKHGEQTAQVWTDSERGTGIRVRSHSDANDWHEATPNGGCTCWGYQKHGHCYNQAMYAEARDVLAKYQRVQQR